MGWSPGKLRSEVPAGGCQGQAWVALGRPALLCPWACLPSREDHTYQAQHQDGCGLVTLSCPKDGAFYRAYLAYT